MSGCRLGHLGESGGGVTRREASCPSKRRSQETWGRGQAGSHRALWAGRCQDPPRGGGRRRHAEGAAGSLGGRVLIGAPGCDRVRVTGPLGSLQRAVWVKSSSGLNRLTGASQRGPGGGARGAAAHRPGWEAWTGSKAPRLEPLGVRPGASGRPGSGDVVGLGGREAPDVGRRRPEFESCPALRGGGAGQQVPGTTPDTPTSGGRGLVSGVEEDRAPGSGEQLHPPPAPPHPCPGGGGTGQELGADTRQAR